MLCHLFPLKSVRRRHPARSCRRPPGPSVALSLTSSWSCFLITSLCLRCLPWSSSSPSLSSSTVFFFFFSSSSVFLSSSRLLLPPQSSSSSSSSVFFFTFFLVTMILPFLTASCLWLCFSCSVSIFYFLHFSRTRPKRWLAVGRLTLSPSLCVKLEPSVEGPGEVLCCLDCTRFTWWWCRASCPLMSVDILGTNWDQCLSMVQCCFTSTETVRLFRTESPGRPPRLSHSTWTHLASYAPDMSDKTGCRHSRVTVSTAWTSFLVSSPSPPPHTPYHPPLAHRHDSAPPEMCVPAWHACRPPS